MTTLATASTADSLAQQIRARRLWYHDIEVCPGLRTRFPEDYEANPVLRAVDDGNKQLLDRLERRFPEGLEGRRVLDLGCADGLFAAWAARRGASRVVGVERNRYNYERASWLAGELGLDQAEFIWGGAEHDCPQESFDLVLCVGLIYHLVDPLGGLHAFRRRCSQWLVLASAIDLPDGDGTPISRLDRYVTGAHGIWSFNVPMVRQLLSTAGFEIDEEHVDQTGGGRSYFAIARAGEFGHHHIFENTIDQEFPINIQRRREVVRKTWRRLAEDGGGPIALFGAGTHTPWLLAQVADIDGVRVDCVLDDRPPPGGTVAGLPVRKPDDTTLTQLKTIVVSSWHQAEAIRRRVVDLYGDNATVISFDQ